MGSYTEFRGTLKVDEGTLNKAVWEEFIRGFGAVGIARRSKDYSVDGIITDTHYSKLVFTGSWETVNIALDIRKYLVFFANRGIFFKGRLHCRYETGSLYAVDVNGKHVETLEGHIEYAVSTKVEGYNLQETVTYQ